MLPKHFLSLLALAAALTFSQFASAGAQKEEQLAPAVVAGLQQALSDRPVPDNYKNQPNVRAWIQKESPRIARWVSDRDERTDLLATIHYEATRAGLDPALVMGVIYVESRFNKYAISSVGARGYMQVMPWWTRELNSPDQNLFHLRTNLRYGCTILRFYLDRENGDQFMALGRYNGSRGQAQYPDAVARGMQLFR